MADEPFEDEFQTSQPEYQWMCVPPLVRHERPGAAERNTPYGLVRTDDVGLVVAVAGHLGRPVRRDEKPPHGFVAWELNAEPPSAEQILSLPGFRLCEDHPLPEQAEEEARREADAAEAALLAAEEAARRAAEVTEVSGDGQHAGEATDAPLEDDEAPEGAGESEDAGGEGGGETPDET